MPEMGKTYPARKTLVATVVVASAAFPASSDARLIGVQFCENVVDIAETTGIGSLLGASGFTRLKGAASNSPGIVYTATSPLSGIAGELTTIDATSELGTSVVGLNDQFNGIRGLGFAPVDTLYAAVDVASPRSLGPTVSIQSISRRARSPWLGVQS